MVYCSMSRAGIGVQVDFSAKQMTIHLENQLDMRLVRIALEIFVRKVVDQVNDNMDGHNHV